MIKQSLSQAQLIYIVSSRTSLPDSINHYGYDVHLSYSSTYVFAGLPGVLLLP